jgi:hypothetical protein
MGKLGRQIRIAKSIDWPTANNQAHGKHFAVIILQPTVNNKLVYRALFI